MKKKLIVPLSLVAVFILLCIYFYPLLKGKTLQRVDVAGWKGMVQETRAFKKDTGEHTYWTGNLFSGMPTITFGASQSSNLLSYPVKLLNWIPSPILVLFITFCGFFFLLRVFGVSHWLAFVGGLAYMFSSYFFIITAVGHNTKLQAISYMAFVIAGIVLTYKKKYLLGGVIFAIFLSLHIQSNHPQITYYLFLLVVLFGVWQLVQAIMTKEMNTFWKSSLVLVIGAILALGSNSESLYKLYDYSKVSIRGKKVIETTVVGEKNNEDLAYATEWSYGIDETLTLLLPNIKGGASNGRVLDRNSESYKELKRMGVQNPEKAVKRLPLYWGQQLFTEGGVYIGALVFFLFVLGLFSVKGSLKWWIVSATVLAILLAWGRNFMAPYRFFYEYVPLFSKFRNPSMILVLVEFVMPLFAFVGLERWLSKQSNSIEGQKKLLWSGGITLVICVLFALIPSLSGNFVGTADEQLPQSLQNALLLDRKNMLRGDALRSGFIVLAGALTLWLYAKQKMKNIQYVYLVVGVLVLVDMWGVNRRFLSSENFKTEHISETISPNVADKQILQDKTLSFRVMDITENPFNSSRASYFHKSIGGYNAAKLRRYQDLISYVLTPELKNLIEGLKAKEDIDELVAQLSGFRMLNLKYLIYHPNMAPMRTDSGLGNGWFVSEVKKVASPLQEIEALENTDVATTVVMEEEEMAKLTKKEFGLVVGEVKMTAYRPNQLDYSVESEQGGIVVFSEIFHPDWKAFVDDKPVQLLRANYTLMALEMKAGKHKVRLEFKPQRYEKWYIIGIISSLFLLALFVFSLFWIVKKSMKTKIYRK